MAFYLLLSQRACAMIPVGNQKGKGHEGDGRQSTLYTLAEPSAFFIG